jgi:general secretion pathway protein K
MNARPRLTPTRQRGAALLMAMVIVTLVSTIAASMVWQQWRAVQVEGAERVRSQAAWVLNGALDLGRHFLADDARRYPAWDDLTEAWATPLPETRLSSFLAADENNNSSDNSNSIEAFMSGGVTDAQGKFSIRNLVDGGDGSIKADQVTALARLCENVGVPSGVANQLADTLSRATLAAMATAGDVNAMSKIGGQSGLATAPLLPQRFDDLVWLGIDAATLERLRPYVSVLPAGATNITVNVNTASKEVLAAVIPKLDLGTAARAVQARARKPFHSLAEFEAIIGPGFPLTGVFLDVGSSYFEVVGRLRYEDFVIEQRHLVQRMGTTIQVRSQSRFSGLDAPN